jgi:hypothetical protein
MWKGAAVCAALFALPATAGEVCVAGDGAAIARACYVDDAAATGYDHAILGPVPEWDALRLYSGAGKAVSLRPDHGFFEDIAPHLGDLTGDGVPEVIVVQTDLTQGARLMVVSAAGKVLAATGYYGQPHRWLAVAGLGDFDGDGRAEIAYVDRPHLARELVFLRLQGGQLIEVARLTGLTNHRIGDSAITGGVRRCAQGDEVIVASTDWSRVIAARVGQAVDLGAYSPKRMAAALRCE